MIVMVQPYHYGQAGALWNRDAWVIGKLSSRNCTGGISTVNTGCKPAIVTSPDCICPGAHECPPDGASPIIG
jgi:hypothetical protein